MRDAVSGSRLGSQRVRSGSSAFRQTLGVVVSSAVQVNLDVDQEHALAVEVPQGGTGYGVYGVSVALVKEDVLFSASKCYENSLT